MTKTICNLTLATIENIKQTTIAKDVSIILQKTILVFFKLNRRNKRFLPVFGSNRLRFCSWKLPALENYPFRIHRKWWFSKIFSCKAGKMWVFCYIQIWSVEDFINFSSAIKKSSLFLLHFFHQKNLVVRPPV